GNYQPDDTGAALTFPPEPRSSGREFVHYYPNQAIRADSRQAATVTEKERTATAAGTLQSSIDAALARAFLCRFLAKAFENPEREGWQWLTSESTKTALESAVRTLTPSPTTLLAGAASELAKALAPEAFDSFHTDYVTCFGHTVRGDCPMNE